MHINIVCLPTSTPDPLLSYEYLRAAETLELTDQRSATLALLPQVLPSSNVSVVVPISRMSWHAVALPKGIGQSSPRLRTVLDSLLEDRMLDDPGQLHLAIGKTTFTDTDKAEKFWVAACDKAWLHSHLSAIKSVGLVVTRIVPEFVPTKDKTQVHVIGRVEHPLLVATGQSVGGVMCLPFNSAALGLLPHAPVGAEQAVEAMQVTFAEPAVSGLAERLLPGDVRLQNKHVRWLEATRSDWDLAQFDLASTSRTRTLKRVLDAGIEMLQSRRWRFARWTMLVLMSINLVGLNALAWKEKSSQQAQRLATQRMLLQTFPQVKVVVDAPLQMRREVLALRQATGAASAFGLEAALNAVGAFGMADQAGRSLSAIHMVNGELRLKGLGLNSQEVAALSARIGGQGFMALDEGGTLLIKQVSQKGAAP